MKTRISMQGTSQSVGERTSPGLGGSRWYALAVLTLAGTVNWADRQVVPILFPGIRQDLGLTDTQLGVIGGLAFSLIYAISAFGFGYAADRYVRKYVMIFGLVLWSLATAAGGFAQGFWSLFAARFFTGIGEASLYPCTLSLIGERFPPNQRGRALGLFGAAPALGSGLGIGLGGRLADTIGWKQVFFIYGGVGLLIIPLMLSIAEPRRSRSKEHDESTWLAVREILKSRLLRWVWITGGIALACGQGFAAWGPSYFVRELGLDVTSAGALFGSAGLLGGIVGGLLGGGLADRSRRLRPGGGYDVSAVAAGVASALLFAMLLAGPGATAALTGLLATLSIYAIFPGLLAAVLALTPPHRHGAAGALNTLFLGGIASATGPFVVGAFSDAVGSLHTALYVPTLGFALAAGCGYVCTRLAVQRNG